MVSTALVELYRQEGKIRHRLIANLHGLKAWLAPKRRLAAEWDALGRERAELEPSIPHAEDFIR